MTDQITWADIDAAHRVLLRQGARFSYETATCRHCGKLLIGRLPKRTLHLHLEDARAGRGTLASCPGCGRRLRAGNRAN